VRINLLDRPYRLNLGSGTELRVNSAGWFHMANLSLVDHYVLLSMNGAAAQASCGSGGGRRIEWTSQVT
jgi:hypothetical protein